MKTQNRPLEIVFRPGELSVEVSCLLTGRYRFVSQSIISHVVLEGDSWGETVAEFSHSLGRKRKFAFIEMDEILAETLDVLSYHIWRDRGDRTPLDAFNRLLAKQINGPNGDPMARMSVEPAQIHSSREQRTTSELGSFPKWHDRDEPKNTDCPIIVAVYDGTEYLLDGHTRINYWQRIGDEGPHDVNVHIVET